MNRLALTQLCPPLTNRALTAVAAAAGTSASASTTNGSDPPSSSTCFFSAAPACAAMIAPTSRRAGEGDRRDPVVGDEPGDRAGSTSSTWTRPSGVPASRMTSAMASAHCGTLPACLRTIPLPAASAGAAKRKNCQNG